MSAFPLRREPNLRASGKTARKAALNSLLQKEFPSARGTKMAVFPAISTLRAPYIITASFDAINSDLFRSYMCVVINVVPPCVIAEHIHQRRETVDRRRGACPDRRMQGGRNLLGGPSTRNEGGEFRCQGRAAQASSWFGRRLLSKGQGGEEKQYFFVLLSSSGSASFSAAAESGAFLMDAAFVLIIAQSESGVWFYTRAGVLCQKGWDLTSTHARIIQFYAFANERLKLRFSPNTLHINRALLLNSH